MSNQGGRNRLGIQLIIFRDRPRQDLAGVLRDVARAGYEGVEAGNLFRESTPAAVQALFQETGLALTGAHAGYGEFADMAKVDENIQFVKAMGARYLMCSGVADSKSMAGYEQSAEVFNRVGRRCREAGIDFCYHNHNWEFTPFDGQVALHRLAELTDPETVKFCVDVYWVAVGGEDPAAFIHRYASRIPYFHIKDGQWEAGHPGKSTRFTALGAGNVDLPAAIRAAMQVNPEWLVYEQDTSYDRDPVQDATESLNYLRKLARPA
jgi:sugar phosphate isomerase/epimerase